MKHQVHNLFILDASGSMSSIKRQTVASFNELVQTARGMEAQFPEQEHIVSLVSFNTLETKTILWRQPVAEAREIGDAQYEPNGGTPLYDAMGAAINRLKGDLYGAGPHNVLVSVFTDGEENSSREFSGAAIRALLKELEDKGWTFTYIGTGHDVTAASGGINISVHNSVSFSANEAGFSEMMAKERSARQRYSEKIRSKEDLRSGFYQEENKSA